MKRAWLVGLTSLVAACASAPKPVGGPIEGSPGVQAARANPERFIGQQVRWGGLIVAVENLADSTVVEVVSRELDDRGKPQAQEGTGGRFLARIKGFLDPELYAKGRRFTVTGTLVEPARRSIGEYPYTYPVVQVERYYLWEKEPANVYPLGRYYYDPFWDPWYPFYRPWPYGPYSPFW